MLGKAIRKMGIRLYRLVLGLSTRYSIYLGALVRYTAREGMLELAMRFVAASKLEGDYLEFGVWSGNTFIAAFNFAQRSGLKSMRFYAFDSFQGLPEIEGVDLQFQQFSDGQYACSLEQFKANTSKAGVDLHRVKIIPGWYKDVLNEQTRKELPIRLAAVVWVDCDLYSSTVPVLDFITDYLTTGTVLVFDDWFCFRGDPSKGEQRAAKEWLAKHPEIELVEYHKFGYHGNSFIVQKL